MTDLNEPRIIKQPTAEELKPSKKVLRKIRQMLRWQKRSAECDWTIGEPQ
jgi:hypothetical protein